MKKIFDTASFVVFATVILGALAVGVFYLYVIALGVSELIDLLP